MRRMRFTTKVALWSALLAAATLLAYVAALHVAHRRLSETQVDAMLREEADHFSREYRGHGSRLSWVTQREFDEVMSVARDPHIFSEVAGPDGETLARSRSLGQATLGELPEGERWLEFGGKRMRTFSVRTDGVSFRIASDLAHEIEEERLLRQTLLLALPLALLGAGVGAWFVARRAVRPLREMAAAAEHITAPRLEERLPESPSPGEIGQLSRAFNTMLDRLERSFAQAVRFSADASHELKTPLAVARAGLGELLRAPDLTPDHRQRVAEALEHVGRLADITESLLLLARADAGRLALAGGHADAAETVRELAADFAPVAEERAITLAADICAAAPAAAEPWALRMVVMNLLDNAIKYNAEGGRIQVSLATAGDTVTLRVGNTGPGVAPEEAAHLFDRFFRSAHTTEIPGSGLGLSLARELARAMGGELRLAEGKPGWTEFTLTLRGAGPAR